MDIWLVNPYGPIPGEGWRDYRFTLVARALAACGHEVTWFTANFAHQSKQFRSDDWQRREVTPRFAIELVPSPRYERNVGMARLWFERVFARGLVARARTLPRPDVIVAADPPQFCGAAGRILARHHGVPFVIDCLDLWPELFVSSAPRAFRPLVALGVFPLRLIRKRNVRAASLAIAVSDTYRDVLEHLGARRAVTIPIGVDVRAIAAVEVSRDDSKLSLIYAGSLGEHYDLDTVLDALPDDVTLTIAGRGPAEERLRRRASSMPNVEFRGGVDAHDLPGLYAAADAGLVPYRAGSTVALPLKIFDYLAAGLPVITSLAGESWALLEGTGSGIRYTAGDARSLREAILSMSDSERRQAMSVAARAAVVPFDAPSLYDHYAREIEALGR